MSEIRDNFIKTLDDSATGIGEEKQNSVIINMTDSHTLAAFQLWLKLGLHLPFLPDPKMLSQGNALRFLIPWLHQMLPVSVSPDFLFLRKYDEKFDEPSEKEGPASLGFTCKLLFVILLFCLFDCLFQKCLEASGHAFPGSFIPPSPLRPPPPPPPTHTHYPPTFTSLPSPPSLPPSLPYSLPWLPAFCLLALLAFILAKRLPSSLNPPPPPPSHYLPISLPTSTPSLASFLTSFLPACIPPFATLSPPSLPSWSFTKQSVLKHNSLQEQQDMQPQFYAFRWLTLLLSQEFPLPGAMNSIPPTPPPPPPPHTHTHTGTHACTHTHKKKKTKDKLVRTDKCIHATTRPDHFCTMSNYYKLVTTWQNQTITPATRDINTSTCQSLSIDSEDDTAQVVNISVTLLFPSQVWNIHSPSDNW